MRIGSVYRRRRELDLTDRNLAAATAAAAAAAAAGHGKEVSSKTALMTATIHRGSR